jgi:hypothetical protein
MALSVLDLNCHPTINACLSHSVDAVILFTVACIAIDDCIILYANWLRDHAGLASIVRVNAVGVLEPCLHYELEDIAGPEVPRFFGVSIVVSVRVAIFFDLIAKAVYSGDVLECGKQ